MGMKKPIHVLQRGASVEDIINVTAIAVVEVNSKKARAVNSKEKLLQEV